MSFISLLLMQDNLHLDIIKPIVLKDIPKHYLPKLDTDLIRRSA